MENNDHIAFVQLMTGLSVLYQTMLPPVLIDMYWQTLQDASLAEIKTAIQAHVANPDTGHYFPKPADLLRHLKGSDQAQPLQAWSKVIQAIRQVGAYETVVFDDALIHAVITDMGGWVALCRCTEAVLAFKQLEFQQRYSAYVRQPPLSYPSALKGLLGQQDRLDGTDRGSPVVIGQRELAMAVYQQGRDTTTASQPSPNPSANHAITLLASSLPLEADHESKP